MCDPELLRDLAQIACGLVPKLHDACAADHFQIRYLCQICENFVLHAVSEEGIGFVFTQILKWQHRDRFLRNGAPRSIEGGGSCRTSALDASTRILTQQTTPPPPDG